MLQADITTVTCFLLPAALFLCRRNPYALPLHGIPPHFLQERRTALSPVHPSIFPFLAFLGEQAQGFHWTSAGVLEVLAALHNEFRNSEVSEGDYAGVETSSYIWFHTKSVFTLLIASPQHCPSTRWT